MPIPIDGGVVKYRKPDPSGKVGGLGDKVEKSLQRFLVGVIEDNDEAIAELGSFVGKRFLESTEQELIDLFSPFIDYVLSLPGVPKDVETLLQNLKKPSAPLAGLTAGAVGMVALIPVLGAIFRYPSEWVSQQVARVVETELPSPPVLFDMVRRGDLALADAEDMLDRSGVMEGLYHSWKMVSRPLLNLSDVLEAYRRGELDWDTQVLDVLSKQGYDMATFPMFKALAVQLPDAALVLTAFFRQEIPVTEAHNRLTQLGYTTDDANLILRISPRLPGVADLVTMAVREAWRDDIAAKWGYDEAFPAEFADALSKVGYDPDWATRYWRSHWKLPSVTLGYEMMHRRIIGEAELDDLLKISDYPAGWRRPMIDAAYTPFTRVDVRRMYKVGVLTEEQVFEAYQDIGYNAEKARAMTDFTILYTNTTETSPLEQAKELTRGVIEQSYRKDVITRAEAETRLGDIGYSAEDIDVLLSLVEVQRELDAVPDYLEDYQKDLQKIVLRSYTARMIGATQAKEYLLTVGLAENEIELQLAIADFSYTEAVRAKEIEIIGEAYVKRAIDRTTALGQLGRLALPSDQQGQILSEWDMERDLRNRRLTEPQYRKALNDKIISLDDYTENMRGLGFSETDIQILVKMAIPEEIEISRGMSESQARKAFQDGLISAAEYAQVLRDLGYTESDILILVKMYTPKEG